MKHIKIDEYDVYLVDYQIGQGKITISGYDKAYTYSWGSMGSDISDFIMSINSDYFADKLCSDKFTFDPKASVSSIRRYIKEEMSYELPWYAFMAGQKALRKKIKELESCTNQYEFVDMCLSIPNRLIITEDFKPWEDEDEFIKIVKSIFECEPWNFIVNSPSFEYVWLKQFHLKLKKEIIRERKCSSVALG